MTIRYLKNRKDGTIYEWDPILAANSACMEVTEEEAFPERFLPEKQKGRKSKVDATVDDVPAEGAKLAPPEQAAEASKVPHPRAKDL